MPKRKTTGPFTDDRTRPPADELRQMQAFGQVLKERRKELDLTLARLQAITGISAQYISNLETAYAHPTRGISRPDDEKIAILGQALGLSLSRLHSLLGRLPELARIAQDETLSDLALDLVRLEDAEIGLVREIVAAVLRIKEERAAEHQAVYSPESHPRRRATDTSTE